MKKLRLQVWKGDPATGFSLTMRERGGVGVLQQLFFEGSSLLGGISWKVKWYTGPGLASCLDFGEM